MALDRLLKETAFEPEAVEAMGHAYEKLLRDLGLSDCNDPFTEVVARRVIEVASRGVRDATEMHAHVLRILTKPSHAPGRLSA